MSRIAGLVVLAALMALVAAFPAGAQVEAPPKTPTAEGRGGSAATVDPLATQAAIDVLRSGGNAVDAAVAAAGVLGVVEPFSCGIGGGGFMVIYDAKRRRVDTIDSRETAPAGLAARTPSRARRGAAPVRARRVRERAERRRARHRCAAGRRALKRYGTRSLRSLLRPGERIAREGFVDRRDLRRPGRPSNADIFDDFTSIARDSTCPAADRASRSARSRRNPDLAETYARIGEDPDRFYRGAIARDIARDRAAPADGARTPTGRTTCTRADDHRRTSRATRRSAASRRRSATAGSTSTAWARRPRAARPSARR